MRTNELEALGRRLISGVTPPDHTLTSYVENDPELLNFQLRRSATATEPPAAGHIWVSQIAVEDYGDTPAQEALDLLLATAAAGNLPVCPADRKSPLVGGRTSQGWHSDR